MWLECGTLWVRLSPALLTIRLDALPRANGESRLMRYRRWLYPELAELWGEIEDWKSDGRARNTINGPAAREHVMEEFGLIWKADDADHQGLLFTADPLTGVEWTRDRIADNAERDGRHLTTVCRWASKMRPSSRSEFRRVEKFSIKLPAAGSELVALKHMTLLSLMDGNNDNATNGRLG